MVIGPRQKKKKHIWVCNCYMCFFFFFLLIQTNGVRPKVAPFYACITILNNIALESGPSRNSTSSRGGEIKKKEGAVMDRLVWLSGGYHAESREDSASGCHNPFSLFHSASPGFSLHFMLCVLLRISLCYSHLPVDGHWRGGGPCCHVFGQREPSLGE